MALEIKPDEPEPVTLVEAVKYYDLSGDRKRLGESIPRGIGIAQIPAVVCDTRHSNHPFFRRRSSRRV